MIDLRSYFALRLAILSTLAFTSAAQTAEPTIRRWNIAATVIEVSDPDGIFPDVRIGDPVRGFLSYDLATPPDDDDPHYRIYEHPPAFVAAGMTIENPRTASEISFEPDLEFQIAGFVDVVNDLEGEGIGDFDFLSVEQTMAWPDAPFLYFPVVSATFVSPEAISSPKLPASIDLDDWAQALVTIQDAFDTMEEPTQSYLTAEIHTLTPVDPPGIMGDFSGDGIVDAADYTLWRDDVGLWYSDTHYEQWRDNFGATGETAGSAAHGAGAPVPEPTTLALLLIGTFTMSRVRRIQFL